ncbi:MAG: hypothetical protein BMS9Abin13_579 [Patescibacteria group bacterium]|nr:MAG: hypothetical protein BMS9Abin13_579 [Patescibacteria group bacterium]
MKKDIHPQYYGQAKVKCACGNTLKIGSTLESFEVEICSACHPFFTGEEKIMDTAGRVEKFKKRKAAAKKPITKSVKKVATKPAKKPAKKKK